MRSYRFVFSLAPLVFFAACGVAPGSSGTPESAGPPPAVTPENVAEGARLFNNGVCLNCHGPAGGGTANGPALNDKTWLNGDGTFKQIRASIVDGYALADIPMNMDSSRMYRRPMPPRGQQYVNNTNMLKGTPFTDKEVDEVAAYVWSLSHEMPKKPPTP